MAVQTKGFGSSLWALEVGLDGGDEVGYRVEAATAQGFVGELAEPALNQVQPRRRGRGEMQVEPLVAIQPAFNVGMVVRGVVVQNQMHSKMFGHLVVDSAEELEEFLVPMPGQALPDHNSGEHV